MILGHADGIVDVQRLVRVRTRQIDGHLQRDLAIGDIFHLLRDFLAALRKLLLELRDQRFGALRISLLEGCARVMRHAVSDHRHGGQHGDQEDQKELGAKAHRRAPRAGCSRAPLDVNIVGRMAWLMPKILPCGVLGCVLVIEGSIS